MSDVMAAPLHSILQAVFVQSLTTVIAEAEIQADKPKKSGSGCTRGLLVLC